MDWIQLYEPVWPTYLSTTCSGRKSSDSTYFLLWNTRIQPWASRVWGGITWVYGSVHQNNKVSESLLKSVLYHLWFKHSVKRKRLIRYKSVGMLGMSVSSFFFFLCLCSQTGEIEICMYKTRNQRVVQMYFQHNICMPPTSAVSHGGREKGSSTLEQWSRSFMAILPWFAAD